MKQHEKPTAVFALCGSFCTFSKALPQMEQLVHAGYELIPVMSFNAAGLDTRFGTAQQWKQRIRQITGKLPLDTLQGVEPLGPKNMADAMIVAPCTGTTLAKLALGISDTPVTLAVKSMLRGGRPVLLAPSTNDGLGTSAAHIAALMLRKNIYFVPFAQDDWLKKPQSLQSDFTLLPEALASALNGRQMQPVLLT